MKTNKIIAAIALTSVIALSSEVGAATKTTTVGNDMFGATITGSMSYYAPPQSGTCHFYTGGKIDGKVMYYTMNNLASGTASFTINSAKTNTRGWGDLKAGGKTLVAWDRSMTGSGEFSTAPIVSKQLAKKKTIWVPIPVINIPLPFTFESNASVDIRANGTVTCSNTRSSGLVVKAKFGPAVDIAADAKVYVDILIASGGGTLDVDVCKMSLTASTTMTPAPPLLNASNVSYSVDFTTRSTEGRLLLWGKAFGKYGEKELYRTTGNTSSTNIASGSFRLNGSSIVAYR